MKKFAFGLILSSLILAGCSGDDDDNTATLPQERYEITVVNLTNNQPISPTAMVIHDRNYTPWSSGTAASDGLEMIAESGNTTSWITEASTALQSGTSNGLLAPGASSTTTLTVNGTSSHYLTTAAMLVNTNDAFTGVSSENLDDLDVGDSLMVIARVYDAGTEANSETAGTIPGPADPNGEGFNSARESLNKITVHAGVITADDGLSTSVLNESHRFDQGAQHITIKRTL